MNAFPVLGSGGGYELLRVGDTDRGSLVVIPPPYTVSYLKEVLRQAKVYVRPMQRDLPLAPVLVQPHQVFVRACLLEDPLEVLHAYIELAWDWKSHANSSSLEMRKMYQKFRNWL